MTLSYAQAPCRVRADLVDAQQRAWDGLARAGSWWTGAERVAIAAETRNAARCGACRELERAVTPAGVAAEHARATALAPVAVEVVHRIATDPGRLSRAFYQRARDAGLGEGAYVELVGVVVTVFSIDSFCRGLGVPLHALPEPQPGVPSHYRPPTAVLEGAWVATIPADAARGAEADLWRPGRTGNVIRALSLVPDEVRTLQALLAAHYMPFEKMMDLRSRRALDRSQIELVAGRVSALRECFY